MRALSLTIPLMLMVFDSSAQDLPIPGGLKGQIVNENGNRLIRLAWEESEKNDSLNLGYNLLVKFPQSDHLLLYQKGGVIYDTVYMVPVHNQQAEIYEFAILSIRNFPNVIRSEPSKVIKVLSPSASLPNISINSIDYHENDVTLKWEYPSVPDLLGFNIYINDELFETIEKPEQRVWSSQFEKKGKYIFEISAVSNFDIESRKSQKKLIRIE